MCSHRKDQLMQIGDVATRTGLSLRTVRYYEEAGLVSPCARTSGGFRLYGIAECEKLELAKQLKPLGFSLEETRNLIGLLGGAAESSREDSAAGELLTYAERMDDHCSVLESQLRHAREFASALRERAQDYGHPVSGQDAS